MKHTINNKYIKKYESNSIFLELIILNYEMKTLVA